jgi:hypothetical protein
VIAVAVTYQASGNPGQFKVHVPLDLFEWDPALQQQRRDSVIDQITVTGTARGESLNLHG